MLLVKHVRYLLILRFIVGEWRRRRVRLEPLSALLLTLLVTASGGWWSPLSHPPRRTVFGLLVANKTKTIVTEPLWIGGHPVLGH